MKFQFPLNLALLFLASSTVAAGSHSSDDSLEASNLARARRSRPPTNSPVLAAAATATKDRDGEEANSSVEETLNGWLTEHLPEHNFQDCESYTDLAKLNDVLSLLIQTDHPGLQDIHSAKCTTSPMGCDRRKMRLTASGAGDGLEAYEEKWAKDARLIDKKILSSDTLFQTAIKDTIRNGKCYEAVMLFCHSLSASARAHLLEEQGLPIPLLPKKFVAARCKELSTDYYGPGFGKDCSRWRQIKGSRSVKI